jgi:hypothetical protein
VEVFKKLFQGLSKVGEQMILRACFVPLGYWGLLQFRKQEYLKKVGGLGQDFVRRLEMDLALLRALLAQTKTGNCHELSYSSPLSKPRNLSFARSCSHDMT